MWADTIIVSLASKRFGADHRPVITLVRMESYKNGTENLADLAVEYDNLNLIEREINKGALQKVADTIMAIPWSRKIIKTLGSRRVNIILQRLRATQIKSLTYNAIKDLSLDPIMADTIGVEYWDIWGELSRKYHLFRAWPPKEFREAILMATQ